MVKKAFGLLAFISEGIEYRIWDSTVVQVSDAALGVLYMTLVTLLKESPYQAGKKHRKCLQGFC